MNEKYRFYWVYYGDLKPIDCEKITLTKLEELEEILNLVSRNSRMVPKSGYLVKKDRNMVVSGQFKKVGYINLSSAISDIRIYKLNLLDVK